jgi:hypothetical protein
LRIAYRIVSSKEEEKGKTGKTTTTRIASRR